MRWADNVVEESTATTTGAYQLGGVPASGEAPGAQGFVAGIGDGQTCYYYAKEVSGTAWERGIGTVTDAATDTLTRTTIHGSSNAGSAVDWTGKTLRVYCVQPARTLYKDHAGLLENATIAATRSAGAETIHLKTLAGTDPSQSDPVRVGFAKTDGTFEVLEVTAALSLTLSSGSTLGAVDTEPFRLWVTLFNDAGTVRLGAVKCALTDGVRGLFDNLSESSTAEGGAGGADTAGVIYTGTAVTSKTMRVLGYLEYTLTTAGTWDTAPSLIKLWSQGDKLPGDTVQISRSSTGATSVLTTVIPLDDTIPQNTEGNEILTASITPKSAANRLEIGAGIFASIITAIGSCVAAIFRDSTADAVAASAITIPAIDYATILRLNAFVTAGAVSSTTLKLRCGPNVSGRSIRLNGSGGRSFGGVADTHLELREIMV